MKDLLPQQLELAFISSHLTPERLELALSRGVKDDSFQVEQYARAWGLLVERLRSGRQVSAGDLKAATGVDLLADVTDPDLFLDEVLRRTRSRRARAIILENSDLLQTDPETAVERIVARLSAVNEVAEARTENLHANLDKRLDTLLQRRETVATGGVIGIPTGLAFFDDVGATWRPGDFVGILGMPSVGKSWLLAYLSAYANWVSNCSVLFLSPESTIADVTDRLDPIFAHFMGITLSNLELRNGTFDQMAVRDYVMRRELEPRAPFNVRDSGSQGIFMLTDLVALVYEHRPQILAIDGFHLLKLDEAARSWEAMKGAAQLIKGLAHHLGMVVLADSQMQRSIVQANDDPPGLGFSAYGMGLEETANRIIQLAERRGNPFQRVAKVPKARDGVKMLERAYLRFDVDHGDIGSLTAVPDFNSGEVDFE